MIVKRAADKHELEYTASCICDSKCIYPHIWDEERMGCELSESEVCRNCELNLLVEGVLVADA